MATSALNQKAASTRTRLLFIDNIRWALIVLVICHHAAVTYSHVGGWYYFDGPKPPLLTTFAFATFETFNQAFFMGFLFLIAGYFIPSAYDNKGPARFLRDRAIRLGIPAAIFMLIIHPVTVYWLLRTFDDPAIPPLTSAYWRFISSGRVLSESGPMWFAVALLIFCIAYASARSLTPAKAASCSLSPPGHRAIVAFILLMGTCSFLVRIIQPIGTNILNMQLCFFSQYILLFVAGIFAYRNNWLLKLDYSFGIFWFRLACFVGVPGWFLILATSGALKGRTNSLLGGFHWQSAAFSYWEAFFCMGMCLGLTVLFRDRFNQQGKFSKWMSRNSFSAYLFHTPLLVAVTLALKPLTASAPAKFALACLIAVPVVFCISTLLRLYVPGLKRLL